ncbi:hypothetical protein SLA2020_141240 [Shorea laevis]
MKRKREAEGERKKNMEIVWEPPANPPQKQDYIFHNGKRYVRPYYFEFISHVNKQWEGKTIVDLFVQEFRSGPYEYYVSAVKSGRIQVDGQIVPVSYIVKRTQKISHFLHRHEPPVMASSVTILEKEPDVLTVCKPASVPVHPCGQYRKNTVVGILHAEHDLAPLLPDFFRQQIEAGMVKKQYVAKVIGVFPDSERVVDANVDYNAKEGRSTAEVGISNDDTPLKGKAACTMFTRISTNGTYSIVLCEPVTGRTHQIRVHLQYTGHPIANDMLCVSENVIDRSIEGMSADRAAAISQGYQTVSFSKNLGDENQYSSADFSIDPMCSHCPHLAPNG